MATVLLASASGVMSWMGLGQPLLRRMVFGAAVVCLAVACGLSMNGE